MGAIQLLENNQTLATIIGGIVCIFFGTFLERLRRKTRKLHYHITNNRIGLSSDDPIFGSVRVIYRENQVRNLWNINLEISNNTLKDYVNIEIKAFASIGTNILSEKTVIVNSPYIVPHTKEYDNFLVVNPGQTPSPQQFQRYLTSRDYRIAVFNRFEIISMNFLCTRPNDDLIPDIFLDTLTPGLKIKRIAYYTFSNGLLLNVPIRKSLPIGLFFTACSIIFLSIFLKDSIFLSIICWIFGLMVTFFGALIYKLFIKIRKIING